MVGKSWKDISKQSELKAMASDLPVSINDIRDKYFNGESLEAEEREALSRFDNYRIWYLNSSSGEWEFHSRYEELQAKANLAPYQEFLNKTYDLPKQ